MKVVINRIDFSMADNSALQSLYPFLRGSRQDAARIDEALLESVRQKSRDGLAVKEAFFKDGAAQAVEVARALAKVFENGGKLFTMGNGGSSCDAAHIAVEFLHPVTAGRPAPTAGDLSADRTMMSAVANDIGFANVFVPQLIAPARRRDGRVGPFTGRHAANL